jgi:hypothetical protein
MNPAGVSPHRAAIVTLLLAAGLPALAQSTQAVQDGDAFARSLAPTQPGQIVNSNAVNATTWSGQTVVPTTVPSNLGAISKPNTDSSSYTAVKGSSLASFGNKAVVDCSNYVPGPGADPAQTQACAAVNFMTNSCVSPNNTEKGVINGLGTGQVPSSNCSGTYGDAVKTFNFGNQITPGDSLFTPTTQLRQTAQTTTGASCTAQTVVAKPAQYALNRCVRSINLAVESCAFNLGVTIKYVQQAMVGTGCSDGSPPNKGICYIATPEVGWIDGCTALEANAGGKLPTP